MSEKCKWTKVDDFEGDAFYETKCFEDMFFTDGETPEENKFKYCPFCGKEIQCP
jgi:hypothetical protein